MRFLLFAVLLLPLAHSLSAAERPHILWLTSEDHGPQMGCYGDTLARTPNVDALAKRGMTYDRVWSCVPVCAPARTAIITGIYPSSTGGIHMRSMVPLPPQITLFPQLLRAAGYYCTNNSKQDYNVPTPPDTWDASSSKAHWKKRKSNQPFFAVFNSIKSHESRLHNPPYKLVTDAQQVRVPAYHPDTPEIRQDWARYYDTVSAADADAGKRLTELAKAGLADDTIVFYFADHGSGVPRSKRWPGNSGLHVPLVVYFPEKWRHLAPPEYSAGGRSNRLINFVDLAPTVLSLAEIEPPAQMQGRAIAGKYIAEAPQYLFGQRGRIDERDDLARSATDGRYVYLRNFMPHLPAGQKLTYQLKTATTRHWLQLFADHQTNDAQSQFWRVPRLPEELYDLQTDPDEVHNLAGDPAHRQTLQQFRTALNQHILDVRDLGFLPEGEMHLRSAGTTPYELARDPAKYPLGRIFATAELASNLLPDALLQLTELLQDDDSAVRYWAALGILMRGTDAVRAHQANLQPLLADSSPHVRIVAAQALVPVSSADFREKALAVLAELAPPREQNMFVAIDALGAIESLGWQAATLLPALKQVDDLPPAPHERYQSYVPRLLTSLTGSAAFTPRKADK